MTLKHGSIAILIFVGGLAIGFFAQYQVFPSQTEKDWRSQHSEDSSHKRIMAFQSALDQGTAKDATALSQQIDLQMKIEALIIQNRAAQYSNITPFTSLGSSLITALFALAGVVGGWFVHKKSIASEEKHGAS